jgi:hypothetical protein
VNWVTLLGNRLLERAGGERAVRSMLGPGVDVRPLDTGNGIAIVAGDHPETGDLAAGNDLPLYRSVGRTLRTLRAEELHNTKFLPVPGFAMPTRSNYDPGGSHGERWLERFFA